MMKINLENIYSTSKGLNSKKAANISDKNVNDTK